MKEITQSLRRDALFLNKATHLVIINFAQVKITDRHRLKIDIYRHNIYPCYAHLTAKIQVCSKGRWEVCGVEAG